MDEKISLEAIALYSNAYAEKMLKKFFANKSNVTGQEILMFSDVQQVNLFIIRDLFKTWKEETKKLKSPFFDYEKTEVKEALETFMNVLSKNISIDREHFAPLLKKSVSQTLLAIFNPYDYFSIIISGINNNMNVDTFREELKYLRINKAPLEKLLHHFDEKKVKELSGNEAFAMLDHILEEVNFTPEDVDGYIGRFSSVEPLNPETFYMKKPEPVQPAKQENTERSTINDSLATQPKPTVADNFKKIDSIKNRLTINQKFMFTKVLFHGDFELFSKAIDDLDRQDDMPGALRYLERLYDEWDRESEEFHEFMEMVEKRFS
ncbi:MAG: hypothetical protein KF845_00430 [Cyclobacteriaceae bacterium]|nr:hypothetical protein [Cyclobacteriaceae bacterium]